MVSLVYADVQAHDTAGTSYTLTALPAGIQTGDKMMVGIAYDSGASSRVDGQSAGPTLTYLGRWLSTGVKGLVYYRDCEDSDSSQTITLTQNGAIILAVTSVIILRGFAAPGAPNVAIKYGGVSTNHVMPALQAVGDSYEVHFVFDYRNTGTQTTNWTAPGTITRADQAFNTGASQLASGAIGYNITNLISSGGVSQSGTWVTDTSEETTMFTMLVSVTGGTTPKDHQVSAVPAMGAAGRF